MTKTNKIRTRLGDFITEERKACGVSVVDFCKLAGIGRDTYYHILGGKTC